VKEQRTFEMGAGRELIGEDGCGGRVAKGGIENRLEGKGVGKERVRREKSGTG